MAYFALAILKQYEKLRKILEVIENEINFFFFLKTKKKRQFQKGFVSKKYVTGRFLETSLISEKDPFC